MFHLVVNLVGLLTLPQSFVEALTQSYIMLTLGTLDELLDFPGAGTSGLIRLLLLHRLAILLSVWLRWRSGGGGRRSGGSFLAAATTAESSGQGGTGHVSNS